MMTTLGSYRSELRGGADCDAARDWLADLGARMQAGEGQVLTAGRNENRRMQMPTGSGACEVVVKAFGTPGWLERTRIRWMGSKARRSWRAALHLQGAGVGTPEPLALLERWHHGRLAESFLVTRFVADASSFAHELVHLYRYEPDGTKVMALLQAVAPAIRAMHDAGFVHFDLGNQNILLRRTGAHQWSDVQFLDLNRGRIRDEVSVRERARDLSRIALPSDFFRVFKEMYLGDTPPRGLHKWERRYRWRFRWHSRTRRWRHPLREARRKRVAGDPPAYPDQKAIWVWDPLSRQPLVTMLRRDRKRHYTLGRHLYVLFAALRLCPGTFRQYRRQLSSAYQKPISMRGRVGVAVDWTSRADAERTLAKLAELGRIPVLVRFYRHANVSHLEGTAELVQQLHARGHAVGVALLQDRAAVQKPDLWQGFVDDVLGRVAQWVTWVEIGHAINRVKWGLWNFSEYRRMMMPMVSWRERLPKVRFTGPSVIDFEYAYVAAALESLPTGMRFDAMSHHLYVDRRGAPEQRQGRFALLEKLALARGMATAHRNCGASLILSEFNWPLAGTGIYSPVGAPYVSPGVRRGDPSVSEEDAAAYLVRYILIAICSGLAEQVYWWNLAAHGFGLIDDLSGAWRERPAYLALQTFGQRLDGWVFSDRQDIVMQQGAAIQFRFVHEEEAARELFVLYTTEAAFTLKGGPSGTIYDTYGKIIPEQEEAIPVSGWPVYVITNPVERAGRKMR